MAVRTAGLQTHIWNNNLKSLILLGIYPLLIMFLVWVCTYALYEFSGINTPSSSPATLQATSFIYDFWPAIIAFVLIWFAVSYFFHTHMIANMSHAHPVTRKEEPELYNMLENMCIAEGMAMPKFNIIESHALNAFASGINTKTYTITVTRGLLKRLAKDEVEAVIAHELTHIQNHDVRLLMITIVFTGMVGLAAQLMWSNMRYALYIPRGGNNKKGSGIFFLFIILIILWVGYFATLLMRFALSRRREFMADAGAARITKNPDAMMRALMRISGRDHIPEATADIAFMCVENTVPFMGQFATHPPIKQRIQAISKATGTPQPDALAPVSDKTLPHERTNPWLPRERPFRKRQNPWKT